MKRTLLNTKIHRAVVTGCDLHYVGSIAIDAQLLDDAHILPFEQVHVVNVNNGQRWQTYAIEAPPGSGTVEMRGGGARLASVGDIVIIMTYVEVDEPIPETWRPRMLILNEKNQVTDILHVERSGLPTPVSAR